MLVVARQPVERGGKCFFIRTGGDGRQRLVPIQQQLRELSAAGVEEGVDISEVLQQPEAFTPT